MVEGPPSAGDRRSADGVRIGKVTGGIHDATVAGRDVVETTIDQLIYNVFEDRTQYRQQRDLQDVLELMKRIWIAGVLEPCFAGVTRHDPRLELRPDAVAHPWETVVDYSDQASDTLTPGTTIGDVYLDMDGSLLILGAPRVGKTTALLELARHLLTRAEQDPGEPIPIILDLAWWTDRRLQLDDWLIRMLVRTYYVKQDLARAWLDNDALCLLFDGLDKVEPTRRRESCVQAINRFHGEHGLMPMAVCCRSTAYLTLETHLQFNGAVCVYPGWDRS